MLIRCSYTAMVPIDELKPHPKNRNKHSKAQIERLSKILDYQGWRRPIRVSKLSGFITAGHGALLAAKKNKWKEVPVDFQDYENEDQEYADVQADNAIAAWAELDLDAIALDLAMMPDDFDQDLLGLEEILKVIEPEKEEIEDEIPEVKESICKPGDLWILGNHRLLCGDATNREDVERLMGGEKADMVYTDPPYGMHLDADYRTGGGPGLYKGKDMKRAAGVKHRNVQGDHDDFKPELIEAILRFECDEMFIWGADYFAEIIPKRKQGSWVVWDKVSKTNGEVSGVENFHGSNFELCWSKSKHQRVLARIMHKGLASVENDKRVHPTQKPVKLAEWFFDRWGKDKINIVDLYLGSGSTLIACEKTGRRCFGMEIDPHYCDVIIERWERYSGKKAQRQLE